MCKTCRHSMLEHERSMTNMQNCPLCHTPLPNTIAATNATGTHASSTGTNSFGIAHIQTNAGAAGVAANNNMNSIIAGLNINKDGGPGDVRGIGFGAKK
jgi:hypothetical protein